jgi:hypothetical protein
VCHSPSLNLVVSNVMLGVCPAWTACNPGQTLLQTCWKPSQALNIELNHSSTHYHGVASIIMRNVEVAMARQSQSCRKQRFTACS